MTMTVAQQRVIEVQEIEQILQGVHGASQKGVEDGTRIHVHYKSFGVPDAEAIQLAKRASELGLPNDRYTGRVSKVWRSKLNHLLVTVWVELERDHMSRTFNMTRGTVYNIVVLGN